MYDLLAVCADQLEIERLLFRPRILGFDDSYLPSLPFVAGTHPTTELLTSLRFKEVKCGSQFPVRQISHVVRG
jgi:hypothetical protein